MNLALPPAGSRIEFSIDGVQVKAKVSGYIDTDGETSKAKLHFLNWEAPDQLVRFEDNEKMVLLDEGGENVNYAVSSLPDRLEAEVLLRFVNSQTEDEWDQWAYLHVGPFGEGQLEVAGVRTPFTFYAPASTRDKKTEDPT